MSAHITCAVDNGTSGSVAVLGPDGSIFEPTPVLECLHGKAGKIIKRLDHAAFKALLEAHCDRAKTHVYLERPFTAGPMFITTSILAARTYEATLVIIEQLGIGYTTIDSKEWQKPVLGDIKGSPALKKASLLRGVQMFPAHAAAIKSHGDADGLLIAHHFHQLT
jgi:hypothetical protein